MTDWVAVARAVLEPGGSLAVERDESGLQPCGTPAAGKRHYARGEKPCDACRAALVRYRAELAFRVPRTPAPCGTYAASRRHYRRGERPCTPCRLAAAAYWAQLAAARSPGRTPRAVPECGTYAAARRHRRRSEPLDWACQEAARAAEKQRREARKTRQAA